jgi:hypothetical protein
MNFNMTVVLLRHLPILPLRMGNFALQRQFPYAILAGKSAFTDEREKKLPLRSEMNG